VSASADVAGGAAARNHFSLLGLPVRFAIDQQDLEDAWRAVQAAVHPDRHTGGTDTQRRLALQYSTRINEAHDTLRDPLRRAAYLCELHGVQVDAESNTAMPSDFLSQQMEWRETLDDVRATADVQGLAHLELEVGTALDESRLLLGHLIDGVASDFPRAAQEVRRMMFLVKFNAQLQQERVRIANGVAADR